MEWNCHSSEAKIGFESLQQINEDKENATIQQKIQELCNTVDPAGDSLLHYAARYSNEDNIKYLINLGCKINLQNNEGNTPLLLATKQQRVKIIQTLLQLDANIYIRDNKIVNALQVALLKSPIDVEVAKLFLQHLSNKCLSHSAEIARKLMEIKCPIYTAVLLQNVNVTTCMITKGCAIDAKDKESGRTALHFAVKNVDIEHVDKLVSLGVDVNAQDANGKLPIAMLNDFSKPDEALKIVKILIPKTKLSCDYRNVFMQLSSILHNGTAKIVEIVIKSYLRNFQARDQHNRNVIHYLAKNCNSGIVDVIKPGFFNAIRCKNGLENIQVNECDYDGLTALHYAMGVGNVSFVKYLIKRGANVYIQSRNGLTPFMEAIDSTIQLRLRERYQCIKILMIKEAKPDICMNNYFKIHNSNLDVEEDYVLLKPVIEILALWKADKKPLNIEILRKINSYRKLKEYFEFCISELDKLKNQRIGYQKVTLFCILVKDDHFESARVNQHFRALTEHRIKELTEKYNSIPIYQEILKKNYYSPIPGVAILGFILFFALFVVGVLEALRSLFHDDKINTDYEKRIVGNLTNSS